MRSWTCSLESLALTCRQEKRVGIEYWLVQRDRPLPHALHILRRQSVHRHILDRTRRGSSSAWCNCPVYQPLFRRKGNDSHTSPTTLTRLLKVSKMSKIRKPSIMIPTPGAFVCASLNKVGLSGGARFVGRPAASAPYWSHSVLEYSIGVLGWKQATVVYSHMLHKSIRKRVDTKLAREAKAQ